MFFLDNSNSNLPLPNFVQDPTLLEAQVQDILSEGDQAHEKTGQTDLGDVTDGEAGWSPCLEHRLRHGSDMSGCSEFRQSMVEPDT